MEVTSPGCQTLELALVLWEGPISTLAVLGAGEGLSKRKRWDPTPQLLVCFLESPNYYQIPQKGFCVL